MRSQTWVDRFLEEEIAFPPCLSSDEDMSVRQWTLTTITPVRELHPVFTIQTRNNRIVRLKSQTVWKKTCPRLKIVRTSLAMWNGREDNTSENLCKKWFRLLITQHELRSPETLRGNHRITQNELRAPEIWEEIIEYIAEQNSWNQEHSASLPGSSVLVRERNNSYFYLRLIFTLDELIFNLVG